MTGLPIFWLTLAVLAMAGCDVDSTLRIKPCRGAPSDLPVNERGDQDEFTGHPLAAAALSNGRVLVAFSAQTSDAATDDLLTSEVRIALLDQQGHRVNLCNTSNRDRTLSNPGSLAFGASVAPVDLTIAANHAVALVAWTEGTAFPDAFVRMRFIDGAGCPLADSFLPFSQPAFASSVTWSEQQHAVLATLHDQRRIYRAWLSGQGFADFVPIVTGQSLMYGFPVGAVAADGSAAVVWAENRSGALGILLDPDGNPRPVGGATGQATFAIDLPLIAPLDQVNFSISVAAADRFVIGVEQRTVDRSIPARVMAREYALDGTSLGPAYLLDQSDTQEQESPTFRFAPGGTLVAVWDSKSAGGTVARLFGPGGTPRFNTLSCDDGRFAVGTRADHQFGYPSLLISNTSMLVFHNAEGGEDPLGSATFLWKDQFAALWPGPQ